MSPAPGGHRTVFVSDVHLGSRHCHAAELSDFLERLQCERLYLVGDIVDLWWMSMRRAAWSPAHNRVVEALHKLSRDGTELVYVPGNHDRSVRRFCGLMLPGMQVRRRAIHATADGRRLLVVHGDDYDSITHFGGLQERFGDWLYYRILTGNRALNRLRRRMGLRYWSLSEFLKRQSGAAERYIARFVQAGLDDARRRGLDGIVCGHIGWPWTEEMIAVAWKHKNVFIDTSAHLPKHFPERFVYWMQRQLQDKVMYASDYPLVPFGRILGQIDEHLKLSPEIKKKFLCDNARRAFKL